MVGFLYAKGLLQKRKRQRVEAQKDRPMPPATSVKEQWSHQGSLVSGNDLPAGWRGAICINQ